jgi:hypothetical protein
MYEFKKGYEVWWFEFPCNFGKMEQIKLEHGLFSEYRDGRIFIECDSPKIIISLDTKNVDTYPSKIAAIVALSAQLVQLEDN